MVLDEGGHDKWNVVVYYGRMYKNHGFKTGILVNSYLKRKYKFVNDRMSYLILWV
jgi:hypothetical protein